MTTLIFFIVGIASLVVAFVIDGGHIGALFVFSSALVVFGGTIGAVGASTPFPVFKKSIKIMSLAFKNKKPNNIENIVYFKEIAIKARKEGLLSIDKEISENGELDPFIRKGLELMVDGVDAATIRNILESQIQITSKRHKEGIAIFDSAGGYAPTLGIIGTVMGLVHILGNLSSNPDALGPQISVAFLATLYGVGSANLIWIPISSKLKAINQQETNERLLVIEAILSILEGDNSNLMTEKLKIFLNSKELIELGEVDGRIE
ncbi:flagellar motor protein [Clostridioides difficile]|nr:flagellar motor protein [Clostridioides difficile]